MCSYKGDYIFMKILFVCTGNTCRSPMAEGIMKELMKRRGVEDINIESAGVLATPGTPATELAIKVLEQMGIDIKNHKSRLISKDMINKSDIIFVMTSQHKQLFAQFDCDMLYTIGEFIGTNEEIKDPYGGSIETYQETAYQLYIAIEKILDLFLGERNDLIY